MNILLALEGVLRSTVGAPIHDGLRLYRTLCSEHKVTLALDGPMREAHQWLVVNGCDIHDDALDDFVAIEGTDLRERQIGILRARAGSLDMLIDPSPERVARGMHLGLTSLLFAHPRYARPEFQPNSFTGPRPWSEIAEELDRQAGIASDTRLRIE